MFEIQECEHVVLDRRETTLGGDDVVFVPKSSLDSLGSNSRRLLELSDEPLVEKKRLISFILFITMLDGVWKQHILSNCGVEHRMRPPPAQKKWDLGPQRSLWLCLCLANMQFLISTRVIEQFWAKRSPLSSRFERRAISLPTRSTAFSHYFFVELNGQQELNMSWHRNSADWISCENTWCCKVIVSEWVRVHDRISIHTHGASWVISWR